MSIEKMKKLILMIESNNFNLDEYNTDPAKGEFKLSPREYDILLKSKDVKKNFNTFGKAYVAASDNEDLFKSAFANKKIDANINDPNANNQDTIDPNKIVNKLPDSILNSITEIYKLLNDFNILGGDISQTEFKPKSYTKFKPQGDNELTGLMSNDTHDVHLFFENKDLKKINAMQYSIRKEYKPENIKNFIAHINSNDRFRVNNNITTASRRDRSNTIDIFFN